MDHRQKLLQVDYFAAQLFSAVEALGDGYESAKDNIHEIIVDVQKEIVKPKEIV